MDSFTKEQIINACLEANEKMNNYKPPEPIDASLFPDHVKLIYLLYRINNRP